MIAKAERVCGLLSSLIGSRLINTKLKNLLYKSYVRPILTYASEVWAGSNRVSAHKIELLRRFECIIIGRTTNTFRKRGCYLKKRKTKSYMKEQICHELINLLQRTQSNSAKDVKTRESQTKQISATDFNMLFDLIDIMN